MTQSIVDTFKNGLTSLKGQVKKAAEGRGMSVDISVFVSTCFASITYLMSRHAIDLGLDFALIVSVYGQVETKDAHDFKLFSSIAIIIHCLTVMVSRM